MSEKQPETQHEHGIRIHIDQERYESPNPTTGEALYTLGKVAAGLVLYREVEGDREDELIENSVEKVHLKGDEHFHSGSPRKKEIEIIVNGRKKEVETNELSFSQLVALAFENPPSGPNIMFTITFRRGPRQNPEGTMLEDTSVMIKNGMIFNVRATDKS